MAIENRGMLTNIQRKKLGLPVLKINTNMLHPDDPGLYEPKKRMFLDHMDEHRLSLIYGGRRYD